MTSPMLETLPTDYQRLCPWFNRSRVEEIARWAKDPTPILDGSSAFKMLYVSEFAGKTPWLTSRRQLRTIDGWSSKLGWTPVETHEFNGVGLKPLLPSFRQRLLHRVVSAENSSDREWPPLPSTRPSRADKGGPPLPSTRPRRVIREGLPLLSTRPSREKKGGPSPPFYSAQPSRQGRASPPFYSAQPSNKGGLPPPFYSAQPSREGRGPPPVSTAE